MIFYLTYNDSPSGIFSSQVVDVVKFLKQEFKTQIKLICFISVRNFFLNRSKIKAELSSAIILPMFPGIHRWRYNKYLLQALVILYNPRTIIGRSVFATQLALMCRGSNFETKIIYDGRGAISKEWSEYDVVTHPKLLSEIKNLEKEVVLKSDYRIAVSNKLVKYWEDSFNYQSKKHVVIPCTLNNIFLNVLLTEENIRIARKKIGINDNDIVFVYSGSVAGWQSFSVLYNTMKPILDTNIKIKLLFLSDENDNILKMQHEYNDRIICKKVKPNEVPNYLMAADYGLLIREETITNQVASPVKFAEYIACGLKVIISKNLGDYSKFVIENNCGYLSNNITMNIINKIQIQKLAHQHFSKTAFLDLYKKIVLLK